MSIRSAKAEREKSTVAIARNRRMIYREIRIRGTCRLIARLDAVVRRFLRDHHVVRVRLAKSSRGDADELRFRPQVVDVLRAGQSHAAAQSADELRDHCAE